MKYGTIENPQTGLAIPISGLKSSNSCGIGEFNDLIPMAKWCSECGMDLIQILPINDSGTNSSPYSALSAFALNPIYLHLLDLEGIQPFADEIRLFSEQVNQTDRTPYQRIYDFKWSLLQRLFENQKAKISKKRSLTSWIKKNPWIKDYAVFRWLKETNGHKAWFHWENFSQVETDTVESLWETNKSELLFFAWIQWQLETQLNLVVKKLEKLNIKLKGDIPILINEDSADVWAHPELFDSRFRAGAPPDMFAKFGQNWGFPCYNWEKLEADDYQWWKDRLVQCNKFFHAIRIDHVLGFFRIWRIPASETQGILGHFHPSVPISSQSIVEKLDDFTFQRLLHPHFTRDQLDSIFQPISYDWNFLVDEVNGFFRLKEEFCSEQKMKELAGTWKDLKRALLSLYWNRVLIWRPDGGLSPYWYWYDSPTWHTLEEGVKSILSDFIHQNEAAQNSLWEENGKKILQMMKSSTPMLVCAEDLGAIPPCVPSVLQELKMYSLKIERWAKDWGADGEPFIDPKAYPLLSVCTPSCHDTSTLRGWWDEGTWDKRQYLDLLNWKDQPDFLTVELAEAILKRNMGSNSQIAIFPLQDWLSITYDFRTFGSDEERVNVPGSVNDFNWNWKMKPTLQELSENHWLKEKIFGLIQQRREYSL